MSALNYDAFLRAKTCEAGARGFEVADSDVHPMLKPHQRAIVRWMVSGGRRACFAAFGLGKTLMQLEACRLTVERAGGRALIVMPLGVRGEFLRDAAMLGTPVRFVRCIEDCQDGTLPGQPEPVIYLTNYETVRDGKLDPRHFTVASLDEAAVLRGFGGTKTFREFMRLFAGDDRSGNRTEGVRYRYVATATPSPNDFIELLAYAAYLDIMDVGQAKTRFFKRNSEKADELTLNPHKVDEFWRWVTSWAVFVTKPSDMDASFSDEGYELPPLDVRWHEVRTDHSRAGQDDSGQARMFRDAAIGVTAASREKRDSLDTRIAKLMELRSEDPAAHRLLWHDLEAERHAIEEALPDVASVWGSQDMDERERRIADFADGTLQELSVKPRIAGHGCNFQRHCSWAIFLGIGFKFAEFIQAIHRIHRFLQTRPVRIDLIYTEAERRIRDTLERKWAQHNELVAQMTALIRERGLASAALAETQRSIAVDRIQGGGPNHALVNGDAIEEIRSVETGSAGLVLTSIPFSTQYEYTPSYRDLGHTDNDEHFFEHLGYLTPELLRVLAPGRIAAIHVKDRIVPGGVNGLGFQTVSPFSDKTIAHFQAHGFAFLARKTIVTDVVRENNQTYRLGWSEQCKDGSRMGNGMPEYLLVFRKPPTDSSNGYADKPVAKLKRNYTRSRWQVDAHGFMRSSGNRPLMPEDLDGLPHSAIFKLFRKYSDTQVYDFEQHVALAESLERCSACGHIHVGQKSCGDGCDCKTKGGRLPVTFMLLQPTSWHQDVWTDITRMRTLNESQVARGREAHLCPLQTDIANRCIGQYTEPGELVVDPFAGIGTVPACAIALGRRGFGIELNPTYFADAAVYCEAAERKLAMPTLFDVTEIEDELRESA